MALRDLVSSLAERVGMESDEMESLLSEGSEVDLDQPIAGSATEAFEVFLGDVELAKKDDDGLMWYPMIREGQWAVRPGPDGKKVRTPLKVIAGNSKNQRKEIGLQDLLDAFNDQAIENVTVPTSHNNTVLENTGFIRKMKIVEGKNPKTNKKVKVLLGAYDFTEPDVKAKVERGTIAGRSCGILYDYVNTETGKTYPAIVEHVALTQKPWVTGMQKFGRKLSEGNVENQAMVLSDEEPDFSDEPTTGDEIVAELADEDDNSTSVAWTHEDSPNWMRQQIDEILRTARSEKYKARRNSGSSLYIEEGIPSYRCIEAKPGKALIGDGWGEGANHWVASFEIKEGTVELDEFSKWNAVKSVYVPDDRDPPEKKKEPLAEPVPRDTSPKGLLLEAQSRRRDKTSGNGSVDNQPTPRGGEQMSDKKEDDKAQLSEEARNHIAAAEDRARKAEEKATRLSEQVDRLAGESKVTRADKFIDKLKAIGFSEDRGFSGFLTEIREARLADDQNPALVSEHFSEDGKTEKSLSFSEALERIFDSIETGEDGKVKLGEQVVEPGTTEDGTKEGETKAGEDGKPAKDETKNEKSVEDRTADLVADNEGLSELTGIGASSDNGGGDK